MSLGKTFTNAIVREIGRNYGKAISNSLMGDSHSTPVRMVGGDVSRMRGRTYRNKLDEAIEKFTVKGTVATFNAGINVHTQYFSLVEEANADNVLDIGEAQYLMSEVPRVVQTLEVKLVVQSIREDAHLGFVNPIQVFSQLTKVVVI
jgi:hypothetical protein